MSRIYEALQRAEQERLAGVTVAPVVEPARTVVPAVATEARTVIAKPEETRPAEQVKEAAKAPELNAEAFDFSNVKATKWEPILEKLPALELRGAAVEQFRTLRSRLFAFRGLNTLKTVLLTSGLPREGKSFITANLAVSFARHKSSRVLLIDGDMRRSSLHTMLGCSNEVGLATYLSGKATAIEVMQRAQPNADGSALFAALGSLTFIAGGEEGDKAADLSGSARFRELLEAAEPYFDWILVDSSPVNLVADAVNLAHACDGVLLVVREGVTKFTTAQQALKELKGQKLLGVVLNAVPLPAAAEGYYGYESYDSKLKNPETAGA